jgi:hypothetical protein
MGAAIVSDGPHGEEPPWLIRGQGDSDDPFSQ